MRNHLKEFNQKGSVLIITLIIMSVAVTLAFYIIKLSKDLLTTSSMILDKLDAKIEAESTVELMKYLFSTNAFQKDSIKINSFPFENKEVSIKIPKKIWLNGDSVEIGDTVVKAVDTNAKFDITSFSYDENLLRRILKSYGVENKDIAVAVDSYKDWIDPDDLQHLNGAEKYYYQFEKGYKYSSRNNRNFQDISELKLIRGFENIYDKIKNHLILVYRGGINIYTTDAKTLSIALGISIDDAKQILKVREKEKQLGELAQPVEELFNDYEGIIFTYPSFIVEFNIETTKNEAKEKIYCIISFRPDEKTPFRTIKYQQ
jgi:hypothetical protein